jgi:hypothetical protein
VPDAQIGHIMATIRYLESRGNYLAPPNKGNASGAYQYIARSWNNYAGYAHAYLAPPHIQDERAFYDVVRFLAQWDNDVSMIPVMWYYPAASRNPELMDIVPKPEAGNKLTIREYQIRWLGVYSFISGQPVPPIKGTDSYEALGGLPPSADATGDDVSLAFPVLGPARIAAPACDGTEPLPGQPSPADIAAAGLCVEQAPGIVFGVKLQPVLAAADGIVTEVRDVPGEPISVRTTDASGRSITYAGFNDDNPGTADGAAPAHLRLSSLATVGTTVRAGQVLGFMGDTDPLPLGVRADVPTDRTVTIDPDAVAPHIRITIDEIDGTPIDAYGPIVDAYFVQSCTVGTGPWSMPPNESASGVVVVETTDNQPSIDSEWVIGPTGQVTAAGWAAMINPSEGCSYVPPLPHGPGAAGSTEIPFAWLAPIDVPTSVWIDLALADDTSTPTLVGPPL